MSISYLKYDLSDNFIHNWLVAGPQVIPIDPAPASREDIARRIFPGEMEIKNQPVVRGKLTEGTFTFGDYQGSWSYYRCEEDHLVDHSGWYPTPGGLRSWAYTQLVRGQAGDVQFRLATPGLVEVWLNHKCLYHRDIFGEQDFPAAIIPAHLERGANKLMVCFGNLASRSASHSLALSVHPLGDPPGDLPASAIHIQLPTTIIPRLLDLWYRMENLYAGVRIERDVFLREQEIALLLPDDDSAGEIVTTRLMNSANIIFTDGAVEGKPGLRRMLNFAYELTAGRYQVELLPRVYEYYEHNLRIKKDIPVWTVGNAPYSTAPYGTVTERRREGLLKAIEQRDSIFAEMAKMALNWWKRLEAKPVLDAVERAKRREEGSILDLAGLLGMLYRFRERPEFPADLVRPIAACAQGYRYSPEEPGSDVMDFERESSRIVFHTCEALAGQHFPDAAFSDGQAGRWHFENGLRLAFAWMQERGASGFADWGSSEDLARDLVALSLLVDLVEDEAVQEMASVVMDKIFFTLALSTFQGMHVSAQRAVWPTDLKGGILQPTCGIARLMWGEGVFNHRIEGLVSLACMEQYELPDIIASIALDRAEIWNREQHAPDGDAAEPVNKVSLRTPDTMLASAQDYAPGRPGSQELVWQAALGPAAVVFVNHPACSKDDDGRLPGYWAGNAVLPRVAQWKNTLLAIYDLPEEDWMGFTHACFPTPAFDEYALRDGWAFASKGNGYLAITSSLGLELATKGEHAYHELRSPGRRPVWICQMGRAASDGDFQRFQESILGRPARYGELSVDFTTPQDDRISFGYHQPLVVNDAEIPLSGYPHYENPFTTTPLNSSQMDILYGETVLRLDFRGPEH